MSRVTVGHLKAGIIFGDHASAEYIYLPGGEVGTDNPICILERNGERVDITLDEAADLIARLTLKPIKHPRLGNRAY